MTTSWVRITSLFSLAACLWQAGTVQAYPAEGPLTIKTSSGTLSGFINSTFPDVRQFLGVPYAEPPVGDLRWEPPKRKATMQGIFNATSHGNNCYQATAPDPAIYMDVYNLFNVRNAPQSEDCLNLHVFTPLHISPGKKLPVLIFFPGGGFSTDGSNVPYEEPGPWIQDTQDHIVVLINYRLNIFGYPNSAAGTENYGLMDQRSAVEWVRDNIAQFGGDSARMVLWGQSAGGASVAYWPYTYYQDPIVTGLIAHSGVGHSVTNEDYGKKNFTYLAQYVGCSHMNPQKEFHCMKKVNPSALSQYMAAFRFNFVPSADNKTIYSNMSDRILNGKVANIPMLCGANSEEAAAYGVVLDYSIPRMTREQYQVGYDAINCPDMVEINNRVDNGYITYRYHYEGNFTNISPIPFIGAAHSAEMPMVFGTHSYFNGSSTDLEQRVSRDMQALWLHFLQNPLSDPENGKGFTWPKYARETKSMLVIAKNNQSLQLDFGELVDKHCGAFRQ